MGLPTTELATRRRHDILARDVDVSCWDKHRKLWLILILISVSTVLVVGTALVVYAVARPPPLRPSTTPDPTSISYSLNYAFWVLSSKWDTNFKNQSGYHTLTVTGADALRLMLMPRHDIVNDTYTEGLYAIQVMDTSWYLIVAHDSVLSRTDSLDWSHTSWDIQFRNQTQGQLKGNDIRRTVSILVQHQNTSLYLLHDFTYQKVFMGPMPEDDIEATWVIRS